VGEIASRHAASGDHIFVTKDLAPRLRSIAIDGENRASDHQPVSVVLE
jgi:endonuclease/exonuclease/phosphatase family metal-dependent hydrolase